MDFQKQWYEDKDVKELIQQIYKVMKKYEITKMGFESEEDIETILCYITGEKTEHNIKNGYSMSGFHLEFQLGKVQIDL